MDRRIFRQHERAIGGSNGHLEGIGCRLDMNVKKDAGETDHNTTTHT